MKIAVDAMGGDRAPAEVVRGALEAAREYRQEILLVGDERAIAAEVGSALPPGVEIVHAPEVITMAEQPAVAVRKKRQSSIVQAVRLVKEGVARAVVSAGSTGATMAASLLGLGRIPGIDRPAIASVLPRQGGKTVLLDVGANVDCKPHHLLQFALMGSLYAEKILGVPRPRVGLLNVGEEETKGNELTLAAHSLLRSSPLNFIGNVEGRDLFAGTVDVVVCDGFVGNVVLKSGEGLALALLEMLKEEVSRSLVARVGAFLLLPALRSFKQKVDYVEYGGAPLLGVNGVVIICHGRSDARAIKNAIRRAGEAISSNLVEAIQESIGENQWPEKAGVMN